MCLASMVQAVHTWHKESNVDVKHWLTGPSVAFVEGMMWSRAVENCKCINAHTLMI
jgi:hypothetical protein